jgi:hypothetical protein
MAFGRKTGGRKAGTPNKSTGYLAAKPADFSPFAQAILIAKNKLPCTVCRGTGKTKYRVPNSDKIAQRTCESCYGDKLERLSPETILKACTELMQYEDAKKRAVEVTGEGGGPIQTALTVEFVRGQG